jgi:hypothetical protein
MGLVNLTNVKLLPKYVELDSLASHLSLPVAANTAVLHLQPLAAKGAAAIVYWMDSTT